MNASTTVPQLGPLQLYTHAPNSPLWVADKAYFAKSGRKLRLLLVRREALINQAGPLRVPPVLPGDAPAPPKNEQGWRRGGGRFGAGRRDVV